MGCKYCEGIKVKKYKCIGYSRKGRAKYGYVECIEPFNFGETCDLTIQGNELCLNYSAYSCDSSFNDTIEINFCPMCGKKLNKVEQIEQN